MRIGMFEPKQSEIDSKVQDLLEKTLQDDDEWLDDALVSCKSEFMAFYRDNNAGFDFKLAIDNYIIKHANLEQKAFDELIAEKGTIVQTDVDDYKFIPHDTRY